jgi:predicted kinase
MGKELFLLRGLPGSGKSTLAQSLGGVHLESDMYFVDSNGNYLFDGTKLQAAHGWCRMRCEMEMTQYTERIVVSNTFTQEWEMDLYFELAKKHNYKVYSLVVENRHGGVNVHGCPDDLLDKMEKRFQLKLR